MRIISCLIIVFSFLPIVASSLNETALRQLHKFKNRRNYSIVVLGDSRNRKLITENKYGIGDSILSVMVKSINRLNPSPIFVIHGGDLSLIGKKFELERYRSIVEKSKIPWLSVRGNHELYSDSSSIFYSKIIGDSDYTFDIGKIRYIVVSSCHPKHIKNKNYSDYYISREAILWLNRLLIDAKEKGLNPIIFSHVPPCLPPDYTWHCLGDKKIHPKPNIEKSNVKTFLSMLKYYGVHLAIFSHIHHYDALTKDGITYVITGGAGAPLYKKFKRGITLYHFIKMNIYSGDSIIGNIYSSDGVPIDSIQPIKVNLKSKISKPRLQGTIIDNGETVEFRFGQPLVRQIKIESLSGKTLFDTTYIKDDINFTLNRFKFYRYEIKSGTETYKGTLYH